jgi:hypothetical protein
MELVFSGLFDLDFIGILMVGSKQHVTEDSSEGKKWGRTDSAQKVSIEACHSLPFVFL